MAHQTFKNEDARPSTPWTSTNQPPMATTTGQEQPIWTINDNQQISYQPQNAPTISVVDCCGNVLMTPPANRNVDARNVLPPLPPLIEDTLVKEARQAQAGDTRQVVNSVQPLVSKDTRQVVNSSTPPTRNSPIGEELCRAFNKIWDKLNIARMEMVRDQGNQLCQAQQRYIKEWQNLEEYEFNPSQLMQNQISLMKYHKRIWFNITKNHSEQRASFAAKEEATFRQALDNLKKKDARDTARSLNDNITLLQLQHPAPNTLIYNPRFEN